MKYLHIDDCQLEVQRYSDDFLILKADADINLALLAQAIYENKFDFIKEVIATEVEILIQLNDNYKPNAESRLETLTVTKKTASRQIKLPIYFDHNNDWDYITSYTGLSRQEYIKEITSSQLVVAMYGFMPGFIYLSGLPDHLQIPRKESPKAQLAENSFAVGGPYMGIYSLPSPGGWHVIGELLTPIINSKKLPPIKLLIGDQIKIVAVDDIEKKKIQDDQVSLELYNG